MDVVGVRELRQNLSVYLKRVVEEGATFEVTDHGRPVALLSPRKGEDWYQAMVAAGRIRPATRRLKDIPVPKGPVTTDGTDALQEQRAERL